MNTSYAHIWFSFIQSIHDSGALDTWLRSNSIQMYIIYYTTSYYCFTTNTSFSLPLCQRHRQQIKQPRSLVLCVGWPHKHAQTHTCTYTCTRAFMLEYTCCLFNRSIHSHGESCAALGSFSLSLSLCLSVCVRSCASVRCASHTSHTPPPPPSPSSIACPPFPLSSCPARSLVRSRAHRLLLISYSLHFNSAQVLSSCALKTNQTTLVVLLMCSRNDSI